MSEWCLHYLPHYIFSISYSVCFSSILVARQHYGVLVLICNIRHRTLPKIWIGTFLVRNIQNDFEFILMVKMETRHHVDGSLSSDFLAICNHCVVIVAGSRKMTKFCEQFLHFFKKRSLMVNFSKFCSKSLHSDTDRRCCVKMSQNLSDGK